MLTIKEIRNDLKEIRYYYSRQALFDDMSKTISQNSVMLKVAKYNQAIKNAPPRLYDLYISLYINCRTQAALAYDWKYTTDYIKQLNKKLCEFLLNAIHASEKVVEL